MADAYDIYQVTDVGGTITVISGVLASDISITDETHANTAAQPGDTLDDNVPDTNFTFEGQVVINGVPGYVASDNGSPPNFYVYVPTGATGVTGSGTLNTSGPFNLNDPCFCAGTMISTPDGERAVETLVAGDLVVTADGTAMPVRWLGRTTRSRVFADPVRVAPIRIKAGALDENVPVRDLLVSPGHAMLLDGVLVHAGALVNGSSVVRETSMPTVFTYYHVELDSHALLLAEGAVAESFLDGAENTGFDNLSERPASAGPAGEMEYPRVKAARQLPRATRERLAARAGVIAPEVAIAA